MSETDELTAKTGGWGGAHKLAVPFDSDEWSNRVTSSFNEITLSDGTGARGGGGRSGAGSGVRSGAGSAASSRHSSSTFSGRSGSIAWSDDFSDCGLYDPASYPETPSFHSAIASFQTEPPLSAAAAATAADDDADLPDGGVCRAAGDAASFQCGASSRRAGLPPSGICDRHVSSSCEIPGATEEHRNAACDNIEGSGRRGGATSYDTDDDDDDECDSNESSDIVGREVIRRFNSIGHGIGGGGLSTSSLGNRMMMRHDKHVAMAPRPMGSGAAPMGIINGTGSYYYGVGSGRGGNRPVATDGSVSSGDDVGDGCSAPHRRALSVDFHPPPVFMHSPRTPPFGGDGGDCSSPLFSPHISPRMSPAHSPHRPPSHPWSTSPSEASPRPREASACLPSEQAATEEEARAHAGEALGSRVEEQGPQPQQQQQQQQQEQAQEKQDSSQETLLFKGRHQQHPQQQQQLQLQHRRRPQLPQQQHLRLGSARSGSAGATGQHRRHRSYADHSGSDPARRFGSTGSIGSSCLGSSSNGGGGGGGGETAVVTL
ncbi:hypothetical protein CLOP_g17013 [Closterium sp. NIES-67]|nr:hypothetical protein CLOP_g17013 [Closterium sp. NIES-67]